MTDANDAIAQAEARMKRLREQLSAAPIVDVLGVVSPPGAGGAKSRGEDFWTLRFTLEIWRIEGAGLQSQRLDLQRQVTDEELNKHQEALKSYAVVRLKARVVNGSILGSPQALLEEFVRVDNSDAELNAKATQLQQPVTFTDPVLGTFTLDRRVEWFTAKTMWLDQLVRLSLAATEGQELQDALKTAHTLWKDQAGWSQRVRDYAVQELLSLKNVNWSDDDDPELTPDQFTSRMTLEAITVNPDGSFDFWHDDGDLFYGHSIQISGSLTKGLTLADIPG